MKPRIIEIIIDGYGYNPDVEIDILKSAFSALSSHGKTEFNETIYRELKKVGINISTELAFIIVFNRNRLNGHFCEKLKAEIENIPPELMTWPYQKINEIQNRHPKLVNEVNHLICHIAKEKHYAPWAARTPFIDHLKNHYPSVSTKTSGVEAGYEDLYPEVQGNSETGHQQLGNFVVAPQVPLEIAIDIENGAFYENPTLNGAIEEAKARNSNLNVTIMVSGEFGDDGRVHSCWNHLESPRAMIGSQTDLSG